MEHQTELLSGLLSFYRRKYNTEYESKFHDAVKDLILTNDVSKEVYINFCTTNDIEPDISWAKKSPKSPSGYNTSSCGGGYSRSQC